MDDLLFDIPETKSPRLLWLEKHGFRPFKCNDESSHPWVAIIPSEEHSAMTIDEIMNDPDASFHYIDAERMGYGFSEDEAIEVCAKLHGIKLWNQEGGMA